MPRSHGEPDQQNLKDRTFNQLTIRAEFRRDGLILVVCDCTCGKTGVVKRRANVTQGRTKSCGCRTSNRDRSNSGHRYLTPEARQARAVVQAPNQYASRTGWRQYARSRTAPRLLDGGGDGAGTGLLGPGEGVRPSHDGQDLENLP